ncbi:MAG: HEAT repeat domain-containing protein [Propionibacteriaceae bacterium]|nr:HEAT repeat domain-containing protein [Propionibacteriaceae bacterium]
MNTTHSLVTQFATCITHPERDVRLRAAMDAGTLHDPQVTDILVSRLGVEEDSRVREILTWALVQHGDAAVPAVLALLGSENPLERRQAAHVLSKIGDPSHVPYLLPVVADEDADVAIKAYRAAASTGSLEVVQPLVARLGDGDAGQRDALSNAMQQLGELGVDALMAALSDSDSAVRLHAAEAIAQVGEDAEPAAGALAIRVDDEDPEVALAAVMALGAIGGDAAAAALSDVITSGRQPLAAVARRLVSAAA